MNDTRRPIPAVPTLAGHPAHAGGCAAVLTLTIALATAPAVAQWTTQSPLPTHLGVNGIAAPSPGHLFLATDDDFFDTGGALFHSTDGGTTWAQRDVPSSLGDGLFGVTFLDDQRGWVWGNRNERTTDGGATWEALPLLGSTYFMEFATASFGVASGNFGVMVSRDGGLAWEASPDDMAAFSFSDAATGLGAGSGGVQRTTDGGTTFALVAPGAMAADVTYLSASAALAIVDDTLVRSTDGGLTWSGDQDALGRTRLLAIDPGVALAWGRSGTHPDYDDRILRTTDGGATWSDLGEVIDPGPFAAELAFAVPSAATVIASDGAGRLYCSNDAGASWAPAFSSPGPTPTPFGTAAPAFVDATTGYFAFGGGYVIATTDGGATWSQISNGSPADLEALARFPDGDLVAVGAGGEVLTSAGGNAPWRLRATLGASDLAAVQVVGPAQAVTVDRTGLVHTSTDGGVTWSSGTALPLPLTVEDLVFTTLLDGWVIGAGFSGGALFRTSDGGTSWTPVPAFQGFYVAVDVAGTSGWAARIDGAIQHTTDGGATWTPGLLPDPPSAIHDLDFWDASVGYAVGTGGYAVRSSDGGSTWQRLPIPSASEQLTDVVLLGADELWVATASGKALYSATGGAHWAVMDAGTAGFGAYTAIAASPAGDAWMAGWRGTIRHFAGPPPPPVNQPPVAAYDFLTTGLSVTFTDQSTDADGTIASWAWSFGDSTTSTTQHPTHLFAAAGTYHVSLTVTDDDGDSGSTLQFIVVQPGPGGTFGDFTEVTPLDPLFVTPQDEDFWVTTTAPADYDGDGDLDVAVLGYYVVYNVSVEERLVLLRNDGAVSATEWQFAYVEVPIGTLIAGASDLAWGDADGDGDADLLVGSSGETVLYRNDAGTLVPTDTALPAYWEDNSQADFDLRSISWADYDNDGDLDLLLPSVWDDTLVEYRTALLRNDGPNGTGGRTFTEVAAGLAPTSHAQTTWADYDGDQDLDLLLVNLDPFFGNGFIRRYRNDGGVFVGEDILGALSVEHGEAQWGDYDDDGDLDVLIAGNIRETDGTYTTVLRLYRNDAETYVPVELLPCVGCEGWFDLTAATWADYDSDGDVDILLAGTYNPGSQIDGRAKIYDNQGGVFVDSGNQLPAPRASGDRGGTFSWLDLDGDGDLDYFIAGQYFVPGGNGLVEAQMHVYTNDAAGENQAPTAPTQLGTVVAGDGTVTLSWSPASDDLTPSQALTYDLRLFRGGVAVAGAKRLPETGSLSALGSWTLAGLLDGSYTWTLAAVDSAYNDGPAAQGAFFVGVPPEPVFADGFESGDASAWSNTVP